MEKSLGERGQIKKELITFLIITFGATYLFEFLMVCLSLASSGGSGTHRSFSSGIITRDNRSLGACR